jgi:Flp pilus assembly pilin Flp
MRPGLRTSLPRPRLQLARTLPADEIGATAVEYGLIAALIVLSILSGLKALGMNMAALPLESVIDALQSVL